MRVAERTDRALGIREVVEFFGPGTDKLAGTLHRPVGPAAGGVVLCPSICADFLRNYRREVLLARELARRGIAVQRFHYRGTGNSDGASTDMTFATMRDDAIAAANRLSATCNGSPLAVVGTRFGALTAAAAAGELDGAPLALVDPTVEGSRFFREGFRARMARDLNERESASPTSKQLLAEMKETGTVDVLGHAVDWSLYDSSSGRTLAGEVGDRPRPVLLVQLGSGEGLRPEYERAVTEISGRGLPVDVELVGDHTVWWFFSDENSSANVLLTPVVDWIERQLGPNGGERS